MTGNIDRELGQKTINQTGRRFGIYGTDLGVSFLHEGKLYFLFGDTNRNPTYPGLPIQAMPERNIKRRLPIMIVWHIRLVIGRIMELI